MVKKSHLLRNIIFIVLILIIGITLGVAMFFFFGDTSSNQFDEDNVGEIYYQEIDEEHVSNIDDYISYVDNEILVVASDGVSYSKIEKLAKSYDASIVGYIEQTGDYQLELNDTYTVEELEDLIAQLENEDMIDSASINYITEVAEDEIYYGDEWSEDIESDSTNGIAWNIKAINADLAWTTLDSLKDSVVNPVRVGLIDNGFDDDHEDLGFAETFYNDDFDVDTSSHGTHVAGIMAANSNDATGICGIYPYGEGNLYGVSTDGITGLTENRISSMIYRISFAELIFRNVKVINVSQGWEYEDIDYEDVVNNWSEADYVPYKNISNSLADFLQRTLNKGFDFVIVCSAGNDSGNSTEPLESKYNSQLTLIEEDGYPELYNRIIVVGAINSSYEVSNYSNGGDRTDIYAPGGESKKIEEGYKIYSTIANDEYGYKSGTSMATPHVSGVAAIVWSIDNSLTGAEVKDLILSNSVTYDDVIVLNALMSVLGVIDQKEDIEYSDDVSYGGIFCWIVNSENEDERIKNALVSATNKETGAIESIVTDKYGHFELILSPGEYTLTITADDYEDYIIDSITITTGEINYIGDWIKMIPIDENNTNSISTLNIPSDAKEYNGHYYMIFTGTQTWSEAKKICEELGGHLVTITSQEEQNFIEEYNTSSTYLWIGGYREDDGDTWMWVTGEDWNYENWESNEPDNSSNVVANENRIVLWSHCSWNDLNDENTIESYGYICEWDSLEDVN
ncbi:MAG: S8 family serine peptidase [Erysipelotrichaceae bacterium]|nr:S8 family serine peptidase [Erysipelotrichaceae bacterium]